MTTLDRRQKQDIGLVKHGNYNKYNIGITMSLESDNLRLDRIEEKLDKLTEAMVAMARAEEKIVNLQGDHEKMYERINRLSMKLDDIEKKVDSNHRTVTMINKLFWFTLIAVAGSVITQFVGM